MVKSATKITAMYAKPLSLLRLTLDSRPTDGHPQKYGRLWLSIAPEGLLAENSLTERCSETTAVAVESKEAKWRERKRTGKEERMGLELETHR